MGVGVVGRELRPWWRSAMTSVSPRPAGHDASAGIVEQAIAVLEAELAAPPAPGSAAPSPMAEPMFCAVAHGRPGQTIQLVLGLLNEQPTQPVQVQLFCTDLAAGPGRRIAAERITFEPATLRLAPRASADVVVRIDIPSSADRGLYAGLLRATQPEDLQALVTLHVESPA